MTYTHQTITGMLHDAPAKALRQSHTNALQRVSLKQRSTLTSPMIYLAVAIET